MAKCQHKLFKQIQVLAQTLAQAPAQALMGARRPEAAEKCPTRDASPPLEVALSACVVCLQMMPFCKRTTKRKTANAESRKPGNEPHVHCPAYNLIRNSSNKAYY